MLTFTLLSNILEDLNIKKTLEDFIQTLEKPPCTCCVQVPKLVSQRFKRCEERNDHLLLINVQMYNA